MTTSPLTRRVCAHFLLALGIAAASAMAGPGNSASSGVVVLRNGNVLEGAIRRHGAYYRIEQAGATLQVPAEQVESCCGTLVEAYEIRRRQRVGSSVDAHLELARWCLRHDLLNEAAREILDARTSDPEHPALASLDLQLRQQLEVAAVKATARENRAPAAVAENESRSVELAPPSALLLGLKPQTQAKFVRHIQPMLIQGCSTGGCHQADTSQQLHLDRWAVEGSGNPTLIRRNLESVLAQVDPVDPASSPLLLRARQSHGESIAGVRPSIPLASYQAAMLLEWLNEAAGIEPEPPPEDAAPEPVPPSTPNRQLLEERADGASLEEAAISRPASYQPKDPFDPEAFNRRQAAKPDPIDSPEPDEVEAPAEKEKYPRRERTSRPSTPEEQEILRARRAERRRPAQQRAQASPAEEAA